MTKAVRRASVFAALIAIFAQLFIPASMAIVASVTNTKVADWHNTWHLHLFNGLHWTDTGMWMKKVDGNVEHGGDLDMSGSGYNPSTYSDSKKDQLAKIAYYGYYQSPTNRNYAVTQMIIWETLGDSLLTTPNKTYQSEKKAILDKVAAHDRKPSFNGK